MKISRNVIDPHGRLVPESELLTIDVKPGWKKGTKITFPDERNKQANLLPGDLVFVIDEKPCDIHTRKGNDLIVCKKISLADALPGATLELTSLDGRELKIPVTSEVVSQGFELLVNEGMPIVKEPGRRGNLSVSFDVVFPAGLSPEQRAGLKRILESPSLIYCSNESVITCYIVTDD